MEEVHRARIRPVVLGTQVFPACHCGDAGRVAIRHGHDPDSVPLDNNNIDGPASHSESLLQISRRWSQTLDVPHPHRDCFHGVIWWLATRGGTQRWRNPVSVGLVKILSSSVNVDTRPYGGNIFDVFNTNICEAKQWFALQLPSALIVSHVRFVSLFVDDIPFSFGPPLVELFGSVDGIQWTLVPTRVTYESTEISTFCVRKEKPHSSTAFRYFKLKTQTGSLLSFRGLEIFGRGAVELFWSMATHHTQPVRFRQFVKTCMLAANRFGRTCHLKKIPMELWMMILGYTRWEDFVHRDRLSRIACLKVQIARCSRELEQLEAEYAADDAMRALMWLVVSSNQHCEAETTKPVIQRLEYDQSRLAISQACILAKKSNLEKELNDITL